MTSISSIEAQIDAYRAAVATTELTGNDEGENIARRALHTQLLALVVRANSNPEDIR